VSASLLPPVGVESKSTLPTSHDFPDYHGFQSLARGDDFIISDSIDFDFPPPEQPMFQGLGGGSIGDDSALFNDLIHDTDTKPNTPFINPDAANASLSGGLFDEQCAGFDDLCERSGIGRHETRKQEAATAL